MGSLRETVSVRTSISTQRTPSAHTPRRSHHHVPAGHSPTTRPFRGPGLPGGGTVTEPSPAGQPATLATLLTNALRQSRGDPSLGALYAGSMLAGVHGNVDLERVYRQEMAPQQVELDLHLVGEGVIDHSTNAAKFSEFIRRLSFATKHTAKQLAGSHAWSENLLIEALTPGSIRIALRAPEIPVDPSKPTHDEVLVSTPEATALRAIASMLSLASSEDDAESE